MIKRISLVVSVCLALLFSLSTGAEPYMLNKDKDKYLIWLDRLGQGDAEGKCWGGECRAALAVGQMGVGPNIQTYLSVEQNNKP